MFVSKVVKVGVKIFNMVEVEDFVVKDGRVLGFVINWILVMMIGFYVDLFMVEVKFVVDLMGYGV